MVNGLRSHKFSCSSVEERPTGVQKFIGSTPVGLKNSELFFCVACVIDRIIYISNNKVYNFLKEELELSRGIMIFPLRYF